MLQHLHIFNFLVILSMRNPLLLDISRPALLSCIFIFWCNSLDKYFEIWVSNNENCVNKHAIQKFRPVPLSFLLHINKSFS